MKKWVRICALLICIMQLSIGILGTLTHRWSDHFSLAGAYYFIFLLTLEEKK